MTKLVSRGRYLTYINLGLSANISCSEKMFDVDFYCLLTLRQQLVALFLLV